MKETNVEVPMDIYESWEEIVVLVPLWWVSRDSLSISLEKTKLVIRWHRKMPDLKPNLVPEMQECFRWDITKFIELPQNVYFDRIHIKFTEDNILIVVVPKIIIPEKIELKLQFD